MESRLRAAFFVFVKCILHFRFWPIASFAARAQEQSLSARSGNDRVILPGDIGVLRASPARGSRRRSHGVGDQPRFQSCRRPTRCCGFSVVSFLSAAFNAGWTWRFTSAALTGWRTGRDCGRLGSALVPCGLLMDVFLSSWGFSMPPRTLALCCSCPPRAGTAPG